MHVCGYRSDVAWYIPVDTPAALDRVLACSWTALPTGRHRLVPDACIELLWLSTGPIVVCGPEITAWDFELPEGTTAVGVRFRPGVLPHLLGIAASSIRDIRIPLGRIIGDDAEGDLRTRIEASSNLDAKRRVLESFTTELLVSSNDASSNDASSNDAHPSDAHLNQASPDQFAERVLEQLASTPRANAAHLADQLGVTARRLHRRCLFSFGYGPSTLARILRFQRFLALAETARAEAGRRPGLALLAIDAGYSDQAHLARDCRAITGQTPTRFLADYFPTFPDMSDPYKTSDSFAVTMSA